MLLITRSIYDSANAATGHPALSQASPDVRYHAWVIVRAPGVALRLGWVISCPIRIRLAATSPTDESAFLPPLIELSVCSRQFRVSNEPKMVSGTKRGSPARTIRLIGY